MFKSSEDQILDEITLSEYLLEEFRGRYVVVHPRATAIPLTPEGVKESCIGRVIDINPGGMMIQQEHEDGTKTKSWFYRDQIAFINEVHINLDKALLERGKKQKKADEVPCDTDDTSTPIGAEVAGCGTCPSQVLADKISRPVI